MAYLDPMESVQHLHRTYNILYSPAYLAKLRTVGGGPVHTKLGNGRVYYIADDLDEWIASRSHIRTHTSEAHQNRPHRRSRKSKMEPANTAAISRDYDVFALLAGQPG